MASGRMYHRGEIHMVTNRCEEGRFFMKPRKKVREVIAYWFAKAMDKYGDGLDVYAFCFLSNHFHMLCRDRGGQLAQFMEYFQGNVARAVNRALERGGAHFWQGHYDDQIVDGENAFWTKYLYITTNAVKAGLVRRTEHWRGFCSFDAAVSGKPIIAVGLNRTKFHAANRGGKRRSMSEFEERFEFSLATPPDLLNLSHKKRSEHLRELILQADKRCAANRSNEPALGMRKVLEIPWHHKPQAPKRRRPTQRFACDTKEAEQARLEGYRDFIGEYKRVFGNFMSASQRGRPFHCEWPSGSFPPAGKEPIAEAPAA